MGSAIGGGNSATIPNGAAGGVLTGAYPNPTFASTVIGGSTGPTDNSILRADGADGVTCQAGSGVTLTDASVLVFPSGGTITWPGLQFIGLTTSAGPASTDEYQTSGDFGIHIDTTPITGSVAIVFNNAGSVVTRTLV